MRKIYTILAFVFCLTQVEAQTLTQTVTATEVGYSWDAPEYQGEQPDSAVLFWKCSPYGGQTHMERTTIAVNDTVWFDKSGFIVAFAYVFYPQPKYPRWIPRFTDYFPIENYFVSTNSVLWEGPETPKMEITFANPSSGFDYQLESNAATTRISVYNQNYNLVVYKNHTGVLGQPNGFSGSYNLPNGIYKIFVRGIYPGACSEIIYSRTLIVQ